MAVSEKLMTVEEAAEATRETPGAWYKRLKANIVPSLRIGGPFRGSVRIRQSDFDRYLDSCDRSKIGR